MELRVPFLDLQFTNYYLGLPAAMRQPQGGVEKHLLRSAFDSTDLLPKSILWRHKEAFSDGVALAKKSLFQVIQELVDSKWSNDMLDKECGKYSYCTSTTKEALYYREVFEKNFPNQGHFIPYFWMPQWTDAGSDHHVIYYGLFRLYL